jgi:hypothetical protein
MFERVESGRRILGLDHGDWMLLIAGCLVSSALAFLI